MPAVILIKTNTFIDNATTAIDQSIANDPSYSSDWIGFLDALGQMENSGKFGGVSRAGFAGKYQIGSGLLTDMNFYNGVGSQILQGVNTKQSFASDPIAQEIAAIMEFSGAQVGGNGNAPFQKYQTTYDQARLHFSDLYNNWNQMLGQTFTINWVDASNNILNTTNITLSKAGISAGAHLIGQGAMASAMNDIFFSSFHETSPGSGVFVQNSTLMANLPISGNYADGSGVAFTAYLGFLQDYNIDPLLALKDSSNLSADFSAMLQQLVAHDQSAILNYFNTHMHAEEWIYNSSNAPMIDAVLKGLNISDQYLSNVTDGARVVISSTDGVEGISGSNLIIGIGSQNILLGGNGSDTIIGQGGDTLVGGVGGNDTFVIQTAQSGHAGTIEIKSDSGQGTILLPDGNSLTGSQNHNATDKWTSGSTSYDYNNTTGNMTVNTGSTMIQIDHFDLSKAESTDGYLGIKLNPTLKLSAGTATIAPGAAVAQNGNTSMTSSASKAFTVSLDAPSDQAQTVTVTSSGGSGTYGFSTGANFVAGNTLTITIPAHQQSATFSLINTTSSTSADSVTLTAALSSGSNSINSNTITVNVAAGTDSTAAAPTDGTTTNGSGYQIGSDGTLVKDPADNAILIHGDKIINSSTGVDVKDGNNVITSVTGIGGDYVSAGAGDNYISITGTNPQSTNWGNWTEIRLGNGNNNVTAGPGQVIAMGGGVYPQDYSDPSSPLMVQSNDGASVDTHGNNTIIANNATLVVALGNGNNAVYAGQKITDIGAAIQQAHSANATGKTGDLISVGDGNNTVVGGLGNDAILLGQGNNLVVAGPGSNVIYGGVVQQGGDSSLLLSSDWSFHLVASSNISTWTPTGFNPPLSNSPPSPYDFWLGNNPGGGNDTIYGGIGNDSILAGNGNDYIDAGGGNDIIIGGKGQDTIYGSSGNVTIAGGDGDTYINGETGKNDYLAGEGGNNTIFGGSGNDTIFAGYTNKNSTWASIGSGNNYVYGGSGNDYIYGSGGNDTLIAGDGNSTIYGGGGNEYIAAGGSGNDYLEAGKGNTTIVGGDGNSSIYGGDGTNLIYVGDGNSSVQGGSGATTIYGGLGVDSINGGSGTTIINAGDGGTADGATTVIAGSGQTTIYGGAGYATLDTSDVGSGGDVIIAGSGNTTLSGGNNDTLVAGSGDDVLLSINTTTDVFNAGFGTAQVQANDTGAQLKFGNGISINDISVSADSAGDVVMDAGGGSITVVGGLTNNVVSVDVGGSQLTLAQLIQQSGSPSQQFVTTDSNNNPTGEVVFSTDASTNIVGDNGSDLLTAWGGNATLQGGSGNNTLVGGSGTDLLIGGSGNSSLIGGGSDTLVGGAGSNTFLVQSSQVVINGGGNNPFTDRVLATASYALTNFSGQTNLILEGDGISGTGNSLNDTLVAKGKNDTLIGGSGTNQFEFTDSFGGQAEVEAGSGQGIVHLNTASLAVSAAMGSDGAPALVLKDAKGRRIKIDDAFTNTSLQYSVQNGTPESLQSLLSQLAPATSSVTDAQGNTVKFTDENQKTLVADASKDTLLAYGQNDKLVINAGSSGKIIVNSNTDTLTMADAALVNGLVQVQQVGSTFNLFTRADKSSFITMSADTWLNLQNNMQSVSGNTIHANVEVVSNNNMVSLLEPVAGDSYTIDNNAQNNDVLQVVNNFALNGNPSATTINADGSATLQLVDANGATVAMTVTDWNDLISLRDGLGQEAGYSIDDSSNTVNDFNISGKGSNDLLIGGAGNENIFGNAGNDTLDGGGGTNLLEGGAGNDTYILSAGGTDSIIDTQGSNTLKLAGTAVHLDLKANEVDVYNSNGGILPATPNAIMDNNTWNTMSIVDVNGQSIAAPIRVLGNEALSYHIDADTATGIETLTLPDGMLLSNFHAVQSGNDLLLAANDLSLNSAVLIQGYFLTPQPNWQINDGSGSQSMQSWVNAQLASAANGSIAIALEHFNTDLALQLQSLGAQGKSESNYDVNVSGGNYYGTPINNYTFQLVQANVSVGLNVLEMARAENDNANVVYQTRTYQQLVTDYTTRTVPGYSYTVNMPQGGGGFGTPPGGTIALNPNGSFTVNVSSHVEEIKTGQHWQTFTETVAQYVNVTRTTTIQHITGDNHDNVVVSSSRDFRGTITLGDGNNYVDLGAGEGAFGNNSPGGQGRGAFIQTGNGNNVLIGTGADDVLVGGNGINILEGGSGNDTYYVSMTGNATTLVSDRDLSWNGIHNSINTVVLPEGVTAADLSYRWVDAVTGLPSNDPGVVRMLQLNDGNANVLVATGDKSAFGASVLYGIQQFKFADGSVLSLSQLVGDGTNGSIAGVAQPLADGVAVVDIHALLNTTSANLYYGNGSGSITHTDSAGNTVTDHYTNTIYTGDNWTHIDGTYGSDTYSVDAQGNVTIDHYIEGVLTSDNWINVDGSHGVDFYDSGTGNKTFNFGYGIGQGEVISSNTSDVIELAHGVSPANVFVTHAQNGDMVLNLIDSSGYTQDSLEILGSGQGLGNLVDTVTFADDPTTVWHLDQAVAIDDRQFTIATSNSASAGQGDALLISANMLLSNDVLTQGGNWVVTGVTAASGIANMSLQDYANGVRGVYFGPLFGDSQAIAIFPQADGTNANITYTMQQVDGNGNLIGPSYQGTFHVKFDGSGTLTGTNGNDFLDGVDATNGVIFDGRGGNDTITGSTGADIVLHRTGDGNDTLIMKNGGGQSDTLVLMGATSASDVSFTQDGFNLLINLNGETITVDDYFHGVSGGGLIRHGELGAIQLFASETAYNAWKADPVNNSNLLMQEWSPNGTTGANGEATTALWDNGSSRQMVTTNGNDNITLFAGAGDRTLNGQDGNDYLQVTDGNNLLIGGSGNDTLVAGSGNDTLASGSDNGTFGGYGDDLLIGGTGNDVFQYAIGNGQDRIVLSTTPTTVPTTDTIDVTVMDLSGVSFIQNDTNNDGKVDQVVVNFQDNIYQLTIDNWGMNAGQTDIINVSDGTSTEQFYVSNGNSVLSAIDASGTGFYTYTYANGDTQTNNYVNGTFVSDSWVHADGSSGNDVYNADGSRSGSSVDASGNTTTYTFDATNSGQYVYQYANGNTQTNTYVNGSFTGDSWAHADGSSGNDVYNADGSRSGISTDASGNTTTYAFDSSNSGQYVYTYTNGDTQTNSYISGAFTGDSWSHADGSSGSDVYHADGSRSGSSTDAAGDVTTYAFDATNSGQYVYTYANGNTQTNYYTNGAMTSDSWQHADGSSGSDIYHADGSRSGSNTDAAGDITTYAFDAAGNGQYVYTYINGNTQTNSYVNNAFTGDTWSHADGSSGSDVYHADGSRNGSNTDAAGDVTTYAFDATNSGQYVYTYVNGNTQTNYYTNGAMTSDSWQHADGSSGSDVYHADGSRSGSNTDTAGDITTYAFDANNSGQYVYQYTNGNLQTNSYVNGAFTGDSWSHVDGSFGSDVYNADGSRHGISTDAAGDVTTYAFDATNSGQYFYNFANGNLQTNTYVDGVVTNSHWQNTDGSSGSDYYHADGSQNGTRISADGSHTDYAYDANGNTHQLFAQNSNASLTTETGNADLLSFVRGSGADTVVENIAAGGQDQVQYGSDVASNQLWFQQSGNNLVVSIIGTSDTETFANWYQGSANQAGEFVAGDGKVLLASQVDNLVNAMASFAPPSMGQTTLPTDEQAALAVPLAANWH